MYINTPYNFTGSKYKLLEQLLPLFDYSKSYFVDVFCGGGSIYTNIIDKYDKILVNDIISDLIGIHKNLIISDKIIEDVKKLSVNKDDKEGYLKLRSSYNEDKSPEKLWALMLCCTNNMMRFNKKFGFNQTFGKRSFNDNTQKKINEFINHVRPYKDKLIFKSSHFENIKITNNNTMVYLDPPYLETEAGYNAYFSKEDGDKLYKYIINLNDKGISFALSGVLGEHKNGKRSVLIDKLIKKFNYKIFDYDYEKVARNKNTKNSEEILIYNY